MTNPIVSLLLARAHNSVYRPTDRKCFVRSLSCSTCKYLGYCRRSCFTSSSHLSLSLSLSSSHKSNLQQLKFNNKRKVLSYIHLQLLSRRIRHMMITTMKKISLFVLAGLVSGSSSTDCLDFLTRRSCNRHQSDCVWSAHPMGGYCLPRFTSFESLEADEGVGGSSSYLYQDCDTFNKQQCEYVAMAFHGACYWEGGECRDRDRFSFVSLEADEGVSVGHYRDQEDPVVDKSIDSSASGSVYSGDSSDGYNHYDYNLDYEDEDTTKSYLRARK